MGKNHGYAALLLALERVGSQAEMARKVGVGRQAIWKWVNIYKQVPPLKVLDVEKASGVSRHDLSPTYYPREPAA